MKIDNILLCITILIGTYICIAEKNPIGFLIIIIGVSNRYLADIHKELKDKNKEVE